MPKTIQMHACNVCGTVYRSFADACACEALPREDCGFVVGATLAYEDESTMFGSRYSYCTMSGTILHVFYSKDNNSTQHKHCCIVSVNGRPYEAMVALVNSEFGPKLVSLAEWKYNAGYADALILGGNCGHG